MATQHLQSRKKTSAALDPSPLPLTELPSRLATKPQQQVTNGMQPTSPRPQPQQARKKLSKQAQQQQTLLQQTLGQIQQQLSQPTHAWRAVDSRRLASALKYTPALIGHLTNMLQEKNIHSLRQLPPAAVLEIIKAFQKDCRNIANRLVNNDSKQPTDFNDAKVISLNSADTLDNQLFMNTQAAIAEAMTLQAAQEETNNSLNQNNITNMAEISYEVTAHENLEHSIEAESDNLLHHKHELEDNEDPHSHIAKPEPGQDKTEKNDLSKELGSVFNKLDSKPEKGTTHSFEKILEKVFKGEEHSAEAKAGASASAAPTPSPFNE